MQLNRELLEQMKAACKEARDKNGMRTWSEVQIALNRFRSSLFPSDISALIVIAEAARNFVWEPENWEAYQDSKDSNSVAWPPEFLLLAQAVETTFGSMPVDGDVDVKEREP